MRVTFLLEDASLYGGVKIVLQLADLLAKLGFAVQVVAKGGPPQWCPLTVPFIGVAELTPSQIPSSDLYVATFWTTLAPAMAMPSGTKVHFCQGLEFTYTENTSDHPAIRAAYSKSIPAWVLSPHLGEAVESEFCRPTFLLPPPLDANFKPLPWRLRPRSTPIVALMNPFEVRWKGVVTGLKAVRQLHQMGTRARLWRFSQWPLCQEEASTVAPDRYFLALEPKKLAHWLRRCDLLLAPSWEQEGFGLPVLEAMASGVPVVASDIPAFRYVGSESIVRVPPQNPEAFAQAARAVLKNPSFWRFCRSLGIRRARAFSQHAIAKRALEAVLWARNVSSA